MNARYCSVSSFTNHLFYGLSFYRITFILYNKLPCQCWPVLYAGPFPGVCAPIMSDVRMEWNVEHVKTKSGRVLILTVCRRYVCNRRFNCLPDIRPMSAKSC